MAICLLKILEPLNSYKYLKIYTLCAIKRRGKKMEKQKFFEEMKKQAKELRIELEERQLQEFYQYMEILLEENKKMNLTAIVEPKGIILKHFIDSLTIYPYIEEKKRILDIGTGAGFPGIPIKIVANKNEMILLDSLNKRICFLQRVIQDLKLEKIQAIHARAEDFIKQKQQRESYDIVTSRAVAKLNVLLEYMLPFTKVGGICICMKAQEIEEELQEAKRAIEVLGGKIEKVDKVILPQEDIQRKIVIIRKIKQTPNCYPRKAGTPTKEPII